jgi:hypothetical protein
MHTMTKRQGKSGTIAIKAVLARTLLAFCPKLLKRPDMRFNCGHVIC